MGSERSQLIINTPDPQPITYDDYDISFVNGVQMSFSIVKDLGDSVDFDTSPLSVIFHFTSKPSTTDPDASLPAEDVTILMQHVISISHRTRLVTPQTKEQQELFKQTFHQLSRTIQ